MDIITFTQSTEGLIAAIGGLLTGLATLLRAFRQLHLPKDVKVRKGSRYITSTAVIGIILLIFSGALFLVRAYSTDKYPLNVELTSTAWNAFNKGDFLRAIANAEKCIKEFRGAADREQAELEKSKVPFPPKGKVSEEEQMVIFARGLLNDVATCFYIKGISAENLGRKDEAKQAYESASKYTYARCWDPKGWFFSPAEAAQDRLSTLK